MTKILIHTSVDEAMPKQLASPAPKVEHVVASAAPIEESVRRAASQAPKVEQAEATPAVPVKAPQADPAIVEEDKPLDDIQTPPLSALLHSYTLC